MTDRSSFAERPSNVALKPTSAAKHRGFVAGGFQQGWVVHAWGDGRSQLNWGVRRPRPSECDMETACEVCGAREALVSLVDRGGSGERWVGKRLCGACWMADAPVLVVLEATGGLEALVAAALGEAALPAAVVNPRQVRDFARALCRLAKTDALDAGG